MVSQNSTVFCEMDGNEANANINLTPSENVYCTFTGYAFHGDCYIVMEDLKTCSWPATSITGMYIAVVYLASIAMLQQLSLCLSLSFSLSLLLIIQ